jgi:YVTN family beta-propeller protein
MKPLAALLVAVAAGTVLVTGLMFSQPATSRTAGPTADGGYLVPSGWKIKPAGVQIALETMPMSTALSPDGQYLLILHGGYNKPSVSVRDAQTLQEVSRLELADAWLGMAFEPKGKFVYVGGGSQARVYELAFDQGRISLAREFPLVEAEKRQNTDFTGDVTISPDGRLIYAADLYHDQVAVINPQSGRVIERFKTGRRPYRILFHPDGQSFYVSNWADGTVSHLRASDGERLGLIRLGAHPTDLVWSDRVPADADGDKPDWKYRLFVTAANTNSVYSVAVTPAKEMRVLEVINIAMTSRQPLGMTPSALALSPDQTSLFVVCSDGNVAAAVDVKEKRSQVRGFVPTGWYPTAARVLADGRLLVLNGRGSRSHPNPNGPRPVRTDSPVHGGVRSVEYVGRIQAGSLSVVNPFSEADLEAFTKQSFANSPYRDALLDRAEVVPEGPIPARPGDPTPLRHVIYILKENRTYDQVLGGLGKGNGDPQLVLFDESSAPNHYKLAREFALFDNFYVSADVSADGHNWSTAAIASDYVQKLWPNSYGGRRRKYDYEGGEPAAIPPAGYLWNNAAAAGVTMRNYGFWAANYKEKQADGTWVETVRDATLARVTNRKFPAFNLDIPDVERARVFIDELREFEQKGEMPRLILLRLGNDHTSGTSPGKVAPLSAMADNDYALGQIIEAVSKSKFWAATAIFVIEDDAQNGADHVDSHRSPAYVISPYIRRGGVDSTFYNTTSVLRTIGLILGLRPMTQFDAASRPFAAAFQAKPDLAPYAAEKPRIRLDERNPERNPTAARSQRMDFSEADRIDDDELNDILWRAIRRSEPPAPVRSYFGR